jgi:hypothetical protein
MNGNAEREGCEVALDQSRDTNIKKWDGAARRKLDWDGLGRVCCSLANILENRSIPILMAIYLTQVRTLTCGTQKEIV